MNKPQSTHSQYLEYLLDSQVTADELFAKAKQIKDSNPSQKKLHDFLEFGHLSNVNKTISDANSFCVDAGLSVIFLNLIKHSDLVFHL